MAYVSSQAFSPRGTILQVGFGGSSPYIFSQLSEVKKITFSGSKYDLADVTNVQSGSFREYLPTLADAGELSFEANFLPTDNTQVQLISLFNNATLAPWQVVLPNNLGTFFFNAYVSSIDRDLTIGKEAVLSGKLKITGPIGFWI